MSEWGKKSSAWNKQAQATPVAEKQETAKPVKQTYVKGVWINKETLALAEKDERVGDIANALKDRAKEFRDSIKENEIVSSGKNPNIVISVEPATNYDRDTKTSVPMLHEDGSPIYKATAKISEGKETLSFFAREKISDGVKFSTMVAMDFTEGKPKFYKMADIPNSNISNNLKEIAEYAKENLLENEISNELFKFSVEANKHFDANSDKIVDKEGNLVNKEWAEKKSKHGEKVVLSSKGSDIIVELEIKEGLRKATAKNFEYNENFETRKQGEKPAKIELKTKDDVEQYLDVPQIKEVVIQFVDFEMEKKRNSPEKSKPVKDKDEKNDNARQFEK